MKKIFYPICLLLFLLSAVAQAQSSYKQSADSYVMIAGTSTLHNWTMTAKEITLQAIFQKGAEGVLPELNSLTLTVPAKSLKSAHSAMDNNAYSALKADKFASITFTMTAAKAVKNTIQCNGNLSISGVTKPITLDANCQVKADGTLSCTGSKAIKMSDFKVEPPTFMFGTVKTGDDITISFNVQLVPSKN